MSNTVIDRLKALYWSADGDRAPSDLLKMYHGYMIDKISQTHSSTLKNLAWRIAHVVTGIILYPILGLFACFEMGIKLLNWHLNGKNHNANVMPKEPLFSQHEVEEQYGSFPLLQIKSLKTFRRYYVICGLETTKGEFDQQKKDLKNDFKRIIDKCSNAFVKVYIHYRGSWEKGKEIIFQALDSKLPYCGNPLLSKLKNFERDFRPSQPPQDEGIRIEEIVD